MDRLAVQVLEFESGNQIGLSLNLAKSEAWSTSTIPINTRKAENQERKCGTPGLEKLLGSPLRKA